jgi:hypothetical protein
MASVASAQAVERMVDATKVFPMLDKFLAIAPADRSQLALGYLVTKDGKPASDVRLTLVSGGRRTPLPVAADGRVERLPSGADFAAHAQVDVEAPPGAKLGARLDLGTAIKPAPEISAADCALAITQANAAMHRAAGVLAMLAPRISKTVFIGAVGGMAVGPDGKAQLLPLVKGQPVYDADAVKDAKVLRFTKAPTSIDLE